jgi:hypothetical protein
VNSASQTLGNMFILVAIVLTALLVCFAWYANDDLGGALSSTAGPSQSSCRGSHPASTFAAQAAAHANASTLHAHQVETESSLARQVAGMSKLHSDQLESVNDRTVDDMLAAFTARPPNRGELSPLLGSGLPTREFVPATMPYQFDAVECMAVGPETDGHEFCALDRIAEIPGGREALEFYLIETSRPEGTDCLSGPDRFLVVAIAVGYDSHVAAELILRSAPISLLESVSPTLARVAVARYLLRPSGKG